MPQDDLQIELQLFLRLYCFLIPLGQLGRGLRPPSENPYLNKTKICNFPRSIYDLKIIYILFKT